MSTTHREHGPGWREGDEKWVEDDGQVILRDYGYWVFHDDSEDTPEKWTDAQLEVLDRAAILLERWLNENWPTNA